MQWLHADLVTLTTILATIHALYVPSNAQLVHLQQVAQVASITPTIWMQVNVFPAHFTILIANSVPMFRELTLLHALFALIIKSLHPVVVFI